MAKWFQTTSAKRDPKLFEFEPSGLFRASDFGFRIFNQMIRIVLPHHLRTLARVGDEVQVDLHGGATVNSLLDALESKYPMLRGTIRDHENLKRRQLVRFFACGEDVSHNAPDLPLPEAIASGKEPFFVIGAIAGG